MVLKSGVIFHFSQVYSPEKKTEIKPQVFDATHPAGKPGKSFFAACNRHDEACLVPRI